MELFFFFFVVPRKNHMSSGVDGWMGGWIKAWGWWITEEKSGRLWRRLPFTPSPPFLQPHRRRKESRQKQISGEYPSHCSINHLQVEVGAAEGDLICTPRGLRNPPGWSECVRGAQGSVWDQISGERRWRCCQSVCKNTCQTTAGTWTLVFFLLFFFFCTFLVLTLNFAI